MALEQQLDETLTQAIREKDLRTAGVVRMLKTELTKRRTSKGFSGDVTDDVVTDVIRAYRRQLQKSLVEFEKVGDRATAQREELRFEIAFCERLLPAGLDETALRALVVERVRALGVTDRKQIGKLLGDVMASHKGQVEAADVRRIAEELLAG
jgi:uncharacterized protein YqeY